MIQKIGFYKKNTLKQISPHSDSDVELSRSLRFLIYKLLVVNGTIKTALSRAEESMPRTRNDI